MLEKARSKAVRSVSSKPPVEGDGESVGGHRQKFPWK